MAHLVRFVLVTLLCVVAGRSPAWGAGERLDLRVVNLSLSRSVAHLGETVEATATVENTGQVGITRAVVRFLLSGKQIGRDYLIDLGPNARMEISTAFHARPEGRHQFRIVLDPDNDLAEAREDNNSFERILAVLSLPNALAPSAALEDHGDPVPAAATAATDPSVAEVPKKVSVGPAPKKTAATKKLPGPRPNLTVQVESIDAVHYFDGKTLRVNIRNLSTTARASPSILALGRVRGGKPPRWLLRVPVRGVDPGASVAVDFPWPDSAAGLPASTGFVVRVDADNDINEGLAGEQDNRSAVFRVRRIPPAQGPVVAQKPAPVPAPPRAALTLVGPAVGATLKVGETIAIRWRRQGPLGEQVDIWLVAADGQRRAVATGTRNDGWRNWTVRAPAGQWWLEISDSDGKALARDGPYRVVAPKVRTMRTVRVISPSPGERLYAGEPYKIAWRAAGLRGAMKFELVELGGPATPLDLSAQAADGTVAWTLPKDASFFGHFNLRVSAGSAIGESARFELNPAWVRRPTASSDETTRTLRADLEITRAGYQNSFFVFTISNKGPDAVGADVMPGIILRTYFVKRTPVRSAEDYGVCDRALFRSLKSGDSASINLGRDPDCEFGEAGGEEDEFIFAVTRIEKLKVLDVAIDDPDRSNNSFKAYVR